MEQTIFKNRMTHDEMDSAFSFYHPDLVPNNINVGKFAKEHGYKRMQQMVNGVIQRFYYKSPSL